MNTFPLFNDVDTRKIVAGNVARELLAFAWRVPQDEQIYTISDEKYSVGWRFNRLPENEQRATCLYCQACIPLQLHALWTHSTFDCPASPTGEAKRRKDIGAA